MRVALTGATGFLGAHIAEHLVATGHEPICLVRSTSERAHLDALGITQVPGAIDDADALRRLVQGADGIVHCAGIVAAHRAADYHRMNADGTERLTHAARAHAGEASFLLVSSLAAKGPSTGNTPAPADGPARPVSAYGASKLAAEQAARHLVPDVPVTVLRAPALYGPRDRGFLPLYRIVRRGLWPVVARSDAATSMLYGPDCAELVTALLDDPGKPETIRIVEPADGPGHDRVALRHAMQHATGVRRLRDLHVPAAALASAAHASRWASRFAGRASMLNPDKARELRAGNWLADTSTLTGIAWTARTPLDEGLRITAQWYVSEGWL